MTPKGSETNHTSQEKVRLDEKLIEIGAFLRLEQHVLTQQAVLSNLFSTEVIEQGFAKHSDTYFERFLAMEPDELTKQIQSQLHGHSELLKILVRQGLAGSIDKTQSEAKRNKFKRQLANNLAQEEIEKDVAAVLIYLQLLDQKELQRLCAASSSLTGYLRSSFSFDKLLDIIIKRAGFGQLVTVKQGGGNTFRRNVFGKQNRYEAYSDQIKRIRESQRDHLIQRAQAVFTQELVQELALTFGRQAKDKVTRCFDSLDLFDPSSLKRDETYKNEFVRAIVNAFFRGDDESNSI